MSISISTKKDVDTNKYYSLRDLNYHYDVKRLHTILQAARDDRLMSKYSQLIANNSKTFALWYEKAHAEKVPGVYPIALGVIAIKADLQPEQSILTVRDILKKKRTETNKRNMDLFYASRYHRIIFNLDAPNGHIYSRWDDFFVRETPLDYKYVDNVCAEIIDTEITSYVGKNPHDIKAYFKARQKVLARDILYKNNYWRSINVVSHRLYKRYQINENRNTVSNYSQDNFLSNQHWNIRRQLIPRVYNLSDEPSRIKFSVKAEIANSTQLISLDNDISILLLRNIAMYGLNIPLSMIEHMPYLGWPRADYRKDDILRAIIILIFNLNIKLAYTLDYVQIYTLIYTGVLVDSFSGAKLSSNINLIWPEQISLVRPAHYKNITITAVNSDYAPLINEYKLYLPVYSRIAPNVIAYMKQQITAVQLMSIYGISNYCVVKNNVIYSWSQLPLEDILNNLQLIWPISDNRLKLNSHENHMLLVQDMTGYNSSTKHFRRINQTELINLLQYDNKILGQHFNIANIYNRIDMLRTIFGKNNYCRLASHQTGDGNIYVLNIKEDLHFTSPTKMVKYIISNISTHSLKDAVIILSIIDAYDLFNQPELRQKLFDKLPFDWRIVG